MVFKKVNSDTLVNEEMKSELTSFINMELLNKRLISKYGNVWKENILKYKINPKKIQYVESIYMLSNQKSRQW